MDTQPKHIDGNGQLFIVATPIGNLSDMTYRAVETLKQVDVIAAEDTRNSRKLLQHYGIKTPMITVHEHNEQAMLEKLLIRLNNGENIALISDAGTPLISDPGYRLVSGLRTHNIRITPIPGASSVLTALCAAGLPTDHFRYAGFLSRSGKTRSEALSRLITSDETSVVLESPRRLLATLKDLQTLDNNREVVVARELTKLHEEFVSGPVHELIRHFEQHEPRGEIVLLLAPASEEQVDLSDQQIIACLGTEAMQALPPSARAKAVAKTLDVTKSRVYALINNA
ncbi:16S rRNA (cytidine1402-2'-O)-methyltransferase [Mariprofundus micogutta]|uniref:Ribosomal RNA small subunit methyltransferase I n=1 Tax=Mariprofundus micogutta TaxID=1921010 RepID=A0A1L8CR78_9PROT|nr:16S rRNA (cytidine(1402)-2'-O)-methyltransferase [Mariprofundus micogutta]GAV21426.1 16S rRNA (cytidine1402-2'-O)-methyltransferase [Mariprofundus micogutta]